MGIFLALGLATVAAMVVYFGRLGDGFRKYYEIRVEYPNAGGLIKGANVLLAGARIGVVHTAPRILPEMNGVYVILKIYDDMRIPSASEFSVGRSGLLGDRFVEISLKKGARDSQPIPPGAVIQGVGEGGGFGGLTESAGDAMADIRAAAQKISAIADKLDAGVLSQDSISNIQKSLKNIETASAAFAVSSGGLEQTLADARQAVNSGTEAMTSVKAAAEEVQRTLADARRGRGALSALLNDREMAENLKAFAANLRHYGILWYKDRPPK